MPNYIALLFCNLITSFICSISYTAKENEITTINVIIIIIVYTVFVISIDSPQTILSNEADI